MKNKVAKLERKFKEKTPEEKKVIQKPLGLFSPQKALNVENCTKDELEQIYTILKDTALKYAREGNGLYNLTEDEEKLIYGVSQALVNIKEGSLIVRFCGNLRNYDVCFTTSLNRITSDNILFDYEAAKLAGY